MEEERFAEVPDLILIVGNSLKLYISSAVMIEADGFFKRILHPKSHWTEAITFNQHKAQNPSTPYKMPVEFDDGRSIGMKLYCAAIHRHDDFITSNINLDSLLSFAQTADYRGGYEKIKHGVKVAIESLSPCDNMMQHAALFVRSAFLFDHAECFSMLTDHISKYEDPSVTDYLQDLNLGDGVHAAELCQLTKSKQLNVKQLLQKEISIAAGRIAGFLLEDIDHIEADHTTDSTGYESMTLSEEEKRYHCQIHHVTAMQCLRELIRKYVWRWEGFEVIGEVFPNLSDLIGNICGLNVPPTASEQEQQSKCESAVALLENYDEEIRRLRRMAKDTFSGVCLECFKNDPPSGLCDHAKPVADCPYDDGERSQNSQNY